MKRLDLVGKRFGKLIVLAFSGMTEKHESRWVCQCDCGAVAVKDGAKLKRGSLKSCGCLIYESVGGPVKHGMAKTGIYKQWHAMKSRCLNKNHKAYPYYGGRGITVCDRWLMFENFYADMGDCPDGMSIERKNNDLGYSLDNCKWATTQEQSRNKRPRHSITGARGVSLDKRGALRVRIGANGKEIHIGTFKSLSLAINAREKAEEKWWSE